MVGDSTASESPPAKRRFLIDRQSRVGSWALRRAATPVTCGVAMEVPLSREYVSFGVVLRISTPGAAKWTVCLPTFEKAARESVRSVAATASTLGRGMFAG